MRCETTWSRHLSTILGNNRPGRASTSMAYWKPSRNLVGFLLNDRMERPPQATAALTEAMWERREIENYLCQPETLLAWAGAPPTATAALTEAMWERREIENYLCQPETLLAWAEASAEETSPGPLFTPGQSAARRKLMDGAYTNSSLLWPSATPMTSGGGTSRPAMNSWTDCWRCSSKSSTYLT